MTENLSKGGRLQILIIALVFFGPLILATWMYSTGRLQPASKTNHGALFDPILNLGELLPDSPLLRIEAHPWRLIYANAGDCRQTCRDALYRLRQVRLMLGNEMDRVSRVFLYGASPPDADFLHDQHRGLITIGDKALNRLLEERRPEVLPPGGIYLVDPLDNLIMYFPPDTNPGDMADDLRHLLKLSRIG
jgi:hypothetical protein